MMYNKFKFTILVIAIFVSQMAIAQHPGHNDGRQGRRHDMKKAWMEQAGLTEEQKEAIKAVHKERMKAMQSVRNEMGEKEARLQTLSTADNPNKKAIMDIAEDISDLRKQMYLSRIEARMSVRELLNEDQKLIFDNMRKHHHKKRERWMND